MNWTLVKFIYELASKDWMTGAGANNLREMNDQRKIMKFKTIN